MSPTDPIISDVPIDINEDENFHPNNTTLPSCSSSDGIDAHSNRKSARTLDSNHTTIETYNIDPAGTVTTYKTLHDSPQHQAYHVEKNQLKKKHKCDKCSKSYSRYQMLLVHKKAHEKVYSFICKFCSLRFMEETEKKQHEKKCRVNAYVCARCNKVFTKFYTFQEHKKMHIGEFRIQCSRCFEGFKEKTDKTEHEKTCNLQLYKCDQCDFATVIKQYMDRHTIHLTERPHKCDRCSKTFTKALAVKDHKKVHIGELPFECSTCFDGFLDKEELKKHKKVCRYQKYTCWCGYVTLVRQNMLQHEKYHIMKNETKENLKEKNTIHSSTLSSTEKPSKPSIAMPEVQTTISSMDQSNDSSKESEVLSELPTSRIYPEALTVEENTAGMIEGPHEILTSDVPVSEKSSCYAKIKKNTELRSSKIQAETSALKKCTEKSISEVHSVDDSDVECIETPIGVERHKLFTLELHNETPTYIECSEDDDMRSEISNSEELQTSSTTPEKQSISTETECHGSNKMNDYNFKAINIFFEDSDVECSEMPNGVERPKSFTPELSTETSAAEENAETSSIEERPEKSTSELRPVDVSRPTLGVNISKQSTPEQPTYIECFDDTLSEISTSEGSLELPTSYTTPENQYNRFSMIVQTESHGTIKINYDDFKKYNIFFDDSL